VTRHMYGLEKSK